MIQLSEYRNGIQGKKSCCGESRISYAYKVEPCQARLVIYHSAFMPGGNGQCWETAVKCQLAPDSKESEWVDLKKTFPNAIVQVNKTSVSIEIPQEIISRPTSIHLVGSYIQESYRRMQVAVFGEKTVFGKDWEISACLIDDDRRALEAVRQKEERKDKHLLIQPRLLLVQKNEKPIEFKLEQLTKGWKLMGQDLQTQNPEEAWNFWKNVPDVGHCQWTIKQEDEHEQYLRCKISVKQGEKATFVPILEYFEG